MCRELLDLLDQVKSQRGAPASPPVMHGSLSSTFRPFASPLPTPEGLGIPSALPVDLTPDIPDTLDDGTIPTTKLNEPLLVNAPLWDEAKTGDTYLLMVTPAGGLSEEVDDVVLTELLPDPIKLYIPPEVLNRLPDGRHDVRFDIMTTPGFDLIEANTVSVRIDRTMPSPWVENVDAEGVLHLNTVKDNVVILAEMHEGRPGSRIRVHWVPGRGGEWLSEWQAVNRYNQTLTFNMPVSEASTRAGEVSVTYVRDDGIRMVTSFPRNIRVEAAVQLLPVEVREARGNQIRLSDVPGEGATLIAARQPAIPAGSTITFSWEGRDASGAIVEGDAIGYDNANQPTQVKLPRTDLQRIAGQIAIRYVAAPDNRNGSGAQPLADLVSDWVNFDVIAMTSYPAPTVREADSQGMLHPIQAKYGATVRIDADLIASDRLTVYFGDHVAPTVSGSRPLDVVIPADVVGAHMGRTIDVRYTVERNGDQDGSATTRITIVSFEQGDPLLPIPRIDRAIQGTVDLGAFTDDPRVLVDPWMLMGVGQTMWVRIDGVKAGQPTSLPLYSRELVTTDMLARGLDIAAARAQLSRWDNNSDITGVCKVNFAGGDEAGAIVFRAITYRLLVGQAAIGGRLVELEEFDDPPAVVANGQAYRLRFATIRAVGGRIQATSGGTAPYLVGRQILLQETGVPVTARIAFDHPAAAVQLGVMSSNVNFPVTVVAYGRDERELGRRSATTAGWVQFSGSDSDTILALEVISPPSYAARFDNLLVTTGDPWDVRRGEVRETFNDLSLGYKGTHYEFDRWQVTANGGDIEITQAPAGMSGHALAVHLNPQGRIHHLTPQFAISPRVRVELSVRSSATTNHGATVELVYLNHSDRLTTRTVRKNITLSQSTQRVLFNAVNELARDSEYISHFRVVNTTNDTLITTVFYDDIVIE
ncbi:hypothetical protein [Luteibacter sp.]|uniref:hypothetical protein n=1 Tax=Luteibacter sp. TaxID=1886636 RepID=UPI0025B7F0BA|nr:hypothetical protein [Luteibacter sp.]